MKKLLFIAFALTLGTLNLQAQNSPEQRWQMRLRGVAVMPNESANISTIGGDIAINTKFIPELDFTYFFTKNIAAELILGTSKHKVNTVGSNLSAIGGNTSANVDLGSVWLLPPTLTAQYHFLPDGDLRPYVGAGINYTIFYSANEGPTVKNVKYDNTFGFATQLGIDVKLSEKYFLNLDAKYILLKTDVQVDASNLAPNLSIPAKVDINPFLLGIGFGMKF
ncbi:OmpW/AlkL family protein [Sphingobacterium athyrii]|uniref:OmpW family protein n=1 Tax=Sphingobacterium athyrii TaxID=2152717 RepID=A0A363NRK9_9SPHI|nr:OmpW family outer membrane protein [Sphingobacterium athyrii]PUV23446.1 OmpW family protein [Sphingobacterium athyrii]